MTTKITDVNLNASTCDTPSSADNSGSLINSLWAKVGFSVSLGTPGHIKFPDWLGGLMIQWGHNAVVDGSPGSPVNFNPAFAHQCFTVVACCDFNGGSGTREVAVVNNDISAGGFRLWADGTTAANWIAIGY